MSGLSNTYRLSVENSKTTQDIANTISTSTTWTPDTFTSLTHLSERAPTDKSTNDEYWAHIGALGVQSAAVLLTAVAPELTIPLALVGIWAEDAIKYTVDNVNAFAFSDYSRQQLLAEMVVLKTSDAADSYDHLREALETPQVLSITKFQYDADSSDIARNAPAYLRDTVSTLLNAPSSSPNSAITPDMKKTLYDQMAAHYTALDSQFSDIKEAIKIANAQAALASERQRQRDKIAATQSEITGAFTICGFIAKRIFGDSIDAKRIIDGGGAVAQIYNTISRFTLGDIGLLSMSGNLLSAADTLMGLFGGGPDPLSAALQNISNQLNAIQKEMAAGFTALEEKDDQILKAIAALYESIHVEAMVSTERYRALSALITFEFEHQEQGNRDTERTKLMEDVSTAIDMNITSANESTSYWAVEYQQILSRVFNYGSITVASSYFTGNETDAVNLSPLLAEGRADLFFGAIGAVCMLASIPYKSALPVPIGRREVPNPIEWSYATRMYLQLSAAAIDKLGGVNRRHLEGLWNQGLRVREAVEYFSRKETIDSITKLYLSYGGVKDQQPFAMSVSAGVRGESQEADTTAEAQTVLSHAFQLVKAFCDKNGIVDQYNIYTVPYVPNAEPSGVVDYWQILPNTPLNAPPTVYRTENDPLQVVISKGLVDVKNTRTIPFPGDGGGNTFDTIFSFRDGPMAGQNIFLRSYVYNKGWTRRYMLIYNTASFDPGPNAVTRTDILPIMDEANIVMRLDSEWQLFSQGIEQAIFPEIEMRIDANPYETFLWAASAARWAAVLAKWRRTPDNIPGGVAARLDNINIPVTFDDYKSIIHTIVSKKPDRQLVGRDFTWPSFMRKQLADDMQKNVQTCLMAAEGLQAEQGIPEVDEALKMLAGYMKYHNIATPIPKPVSPPAAAK